VLRPIYPEIYNPILKSLEDYDIKFEEIEKEFIGYNPDQLN
jgi:saccharopine dehydrogenase (NAD+, L-glutamate forming)